MDCNGQPYSLNRSEAPKFSLKVLDFSVIVQSSDKQSLVSITKATLLSLFCRFVCNASRQHYSSKNAIVYLTLFDVFSEYTVKLFFAL
jgi:hypothetical protein